MRCGNAGYFLMSSVVFWIIMNTDNLVAVLCVFSLRIMLLLDLNVSCIYKLGTLRNNWIEFMHTYCSCAYFAVCPQLCYLPHCFQFSRTAG